MTIETYTFKGSDTGLVFLALGGIHGDEPCGTKAIQRLVAEIDSGDLALKAGTLVAAPICNPDAYAQQKRFVEHNLNRIIQKNITATSREHGFATVVTKLIDGADIVLDLHSCGGAVAGPFLFLDKDTPEHRAYGHSMPMQYWVKGWNNIYADRADISDGDTITYALQQGKMGLLVECGQHHDPLADQVGYQSLIGALVHFGILDVAGNVPATDPIIIDMKQLVTKDKEGSYSQNWENFTPVQKGQPIADFTDGTQYLAPFDGMIILPKAGAKVGEEWFYLGVPE